MTTKKKRKMGKPVAWQILCCYNSSCSFNILYNICWNCAIVKGQGSFCAKSFQSYCEPWSCHGFTFAPWLVAFRIYEFRPIILIRIRTQINWKSFKKSSIVFSINLSSINKNASITTYLVFHIFDFYTKRKIIKICMALKKIVMYSLKKGLEWSLNLPRLHSQIFIFSLQNQFGCKEGEK